MPDAVAFAAAPDLVGRENPAVGVHDGRSGDFSGGLGDLVGRSEAE